LHITPTDSRQAKNVLIPQTAAVTDRLGAGVMENTSWGFFRVEKLKSSKSGQIELA
jgi:hypothetical protein